MKIFRSINDLQSFLKGYRLQGKTIGLVPTMGALHAGHFSLIEKSNGMANITVVSIFVNPTQFGVNEDFDKYPQTFEADVKACKELGVDIIFAPNVSEMYPEGMNELTLVCPPYEIVNKLCGKSRPGHFDGVAQVVAKLFNITGCDFAFFGQKDAQQLFIIQKMTRDLNFDVKIVPCPLVRDEFGLALSSRNSYLDEEGKKKALGLSKALFEVERLFKEGHFEVEYLLDHALALTQNIEVEYLEFLDLATFERVNEVKTPTLAAIAAKIDGTRLIDNVILGDYV